MLRRLLPLLLLALAQPIAADQITSFSPDEVTFGTELTILGDFGAIAATGKDPKVVGTRIDSRKSVGFEVLSVSGSEIHARVKKVPKSKTDPAAGKEWTLVITPPKGAGDPLQAGETFVTVPPELLDIGGDQGEPGDLLELTVDDLGTGKLTVLFGTKKAKRVDPPLLAAQTLAAASPVFVLVPKLAGGSYPISLLNGIGPSPSSILFTVVVPLSGGSCPDLTATLSGKSQFSDDAFYSTGGFGGVHACEGNATCARSVDVNFDPSNALANPGQGFVSLASISYFESQGGMLPDLQWGGDAQVSFRADSVNGPLRGNFATTLVPVNPNPGSNVAISGVFCAEQNPFVP